MKKSQLKQIIKEIIMDQGRYGMESVYAETTLKAYEILLEIYLKKNSSINSLKSKSDVQKLKYLLDDLHEVYVYLKQKAISLKQPVLKQENK